MKLTTFLVSAVLALGVAAIDPEAGNDVEVRDFSGESLNEFDARDEEEFDVRDEEDLEARDKYPKCKGKNVVWKKVDYDWKCVCTRKGEEYNKWKGCVCKDGYEYSDKYYKCIPKCKYGEEYNPKSGKCEKPFKCKGDNVIIKTGDYGRKYCECTRTGEKYSEKYGCKCDKGYEFSDKYHKCIPICKYGEEYDDKSGKCKDPFRCKGKNVKIETDNYGNKKCKCLLEGQEYNNRRGCECKDGYEYSEKYYKCIPKCKYGEKYNGHECAPVCKGDHVIFKHKECKCLKPGYYYDESYGCKPRCDGDAKWDGHECKCKYGEDYVKGTGCVPKCKPPAYFKKGYCVCPKKDQYYDKTEGCKDRCPAGTKYDWFKKECKCIKWGQIYDKEHKQCYKPCGKNEKLIWDYGRPKCVCKEGYYPTKWGCQKKKGGY